MIQNIKIAEFRLGNYLMVLGEVGPVSEEEMKAAAKRTAEQKTPSESPESFGAREAPSPEGVIGTGTEGASGAASVKTFTGDKLGDRNRPEQQQEKFDRGGKKEQRPADQQVNQTDSPDVSSGESLSLVYNHGIQPPLDPIFVFFEDGKTQYKRGPSLQESKIEPEPGEAVKYFAIYGMFVSEQTDQALTYEARKQFERERLLPSEQNALQMRHRETEKAIKAELKARDIKGEDAALKSKPEPYPNPHMAQKATDAQKQLFGDDVEKGDYHPELNSQGPTTSQTIMPGTEQPVHSPARTVAKTPNPGESKIGTETPSTAHSVPSGEKPEPTGPDRPEKDGPGGGSGQSTLNPKPSMADQLKKKQ